MTRRIGCSISLYLSLKELKGPDLINYQIGDSVSANGKKAGATKRAATATMVFEFN